MNEKRLNRKLRQRVNVVMVTNNALRIKVAK